MDGGRGIIESQEPLARYFGQDGKPDEHYRAAVKSRFVVLDLCGQPFDQCWLNYQHEIGHHPTPAKKNTTSSAERPAPNPLGDLLAFILPIIDLLRRYIEASGIPPEPAGPYTKDELW